MVVAASGSRSGSHHACGTTLSGRSTATWKTPPLRATFPGWTLGVEWVEWNDPTIARERVLPQRKRASPTESPCAAKCEHEAPGAGKSANNARLSDWRVPGWSVGRGCRFPFDKFRRLNRRWPSIKGFQSFLRQCRLKRVGRRIFEAHFRDPIQQGPSSTGGSSACISTITTAPTWIATATTNAATAAHLLGVLNSAAGGTTCRRCAACLLAEHIRQGAVLLGRVSVVVILLVEVGLPSAPSYPNQTY